MPERSHQDPQVEPSGDGVQVTLSSVRAPMTDYPEDQRNAAFMVGYAAAESHGQRELVLVLFDPPVVDEYRREEDRVASPPAIRFIHKHLAQEYGHQRALMQ